jgi:glycerol kinase
MMPVIKRNQEIFGYLKKNILGSHSQIKIPIASSIGDQQSSLCGQLCLSPGQIKGTYGTGAFIIVNTGEKLITNIPELLTTVLYATHDQIIYGLEGLIFNVGSGLN